MCHIKLLSFWKTSYSLAIVVVAAILIHLTPKSFCIQDDLVSSSSSLKKTQINKGIDVKSDTFGYVAEWEYDGNSGREPQEETLEFIDNKILPDDKGINEREDPTAGILYPSKRISPGTWLDDDGSWWLFGGQGPNVYADTSTLNTSEIAVNEFLSDLWIFDSKVPVPSWKPVFRPLRDNKTPISSYPDNPNPILCGTHKYKHLAVFNANNLESLSNSNGAKRSSAEFSTTRDPLFPDDNAVWLFDIPARIPSQINFKGGHDPTEDGVWTSYICCDACLPDENTTLEFCPHFSRTGPSGSGSNDERDGKYDDAVNKIPNPILWCSEHSLMALQVNINPTELNEIKEESSIRRKEDSISEQIIQRSKEVDNNSSTASSHSTISQGETMRPFSSSSSQIDLRVGLKLTIKEKGEGRGEEKEESTLNRLKSQRIVVNKETQLPLIDRNLERRTSLNWWKFDLASTEWIKMSQVNVNPNDKISIESLFNSTNCRTVSDQTFVYILCPESSNSLNRLIYLFDPSKLSIESINNSLIKLNTAFSNPTEWSPEKSILYAMREGNVTIIILAYQKLLDLWIHDHNTNQIYPLENLWKGSSLHYFQHRSSFYKLNIEFPERANGTGKSFFMINPRTKLFQFNDFQSPSSQFTIKIQTDQSVFLPARDASFIINADEAAGENGSSSSTTLLNPSIIKSLVKENAGSFKKVIGSGQKEETKDKPIFSPTLDPFKLKNKVISSEKISTPSSSVVDITLELEPPQLKELEKLSSLTNLSPLKLKSNLSLNLASTSLLQQSNPDGKVITTIGPNTLNPNSRDGEEKGEKISKTKSFIVKGLIDPRTPSSSELLRVRKDNSSTFLQSPPTLLHNVPSGNSAEGRESTSSSSLLVVNNDDDGGGSGNSTVGTKPQILQSGVESTKTMAQSTSKITPTASKLVTPSLNDWNHQKERDQELFSSSKNLSKPLLVQEKAQIMRNKSLVYHNESSSENSTTSILSKSIISKPHSLSLKVKNNNVAPPSPTAKHLKIYKLLNPKFHIKRENSVQLLVERKFGNLVAKNKNNVNELGTSKLLTIEAKSSSSSSRDKVRKTDGKSQEGLTSSTTSKTLTAVVTEKVKVGKYGEEKSTIIDQNEKSTEPLTYSTNSPIETGTGISKDVLINFGTLENEERIGGVREAKEEEARESTRREDTFVSVDLFGEEEVVEESSSDKELSSSSSSSSISGNPTEYSTFGSLVFFALSLSFFLGFGIFVFFRNCVKCPPRRESVLLKEPPPIRYSVIPDELAYNYNHTPIV